MKIKNINWFILYSNNKSKVKILFDLCYIVTINGNYKYYWI